MPLCTGVLRFNVILNSEEIIITEKIVSTRLFLESVYLFKNFEDQIFIF